MYLGISQSKIDKEKRALSRQS